MRSATKEERESVSKFVKSISTDIGVNFFDLMENYNTKREYSLLSISDKEPNFYYNEPS